MVEHCPQTLAIEDNATTTSTKQLPLTISAETNTKSRNTLLSNILKPPCLRKGCGHRLQQGTQDGGVYV